MWRVGMSMVLGITMTGCSLVTTGKNRRDVSHEIKAGETLSSLGTKYGIPAEEIQRYNDIPDPRKLRVGQRVVIPALGPLQGGIGEPIERPSSSQASQSLRTVSIAGVRGYIGDLAYPVNSARYSSRFGWRWSKFHEGIDLAAPEGTPILAAHDGVVVLVSEGWSGYGKVVVVQGDRFMTVYGHNSKNHVEKGDRVRKGQQIAEVGATGDASGPHLHFETRVTDENGRFAAVNPTIFFP